MSLLASYHGVVENGMVRLQGAILPEGTPVVVVAVESRYAPVEDQLKRLSAMTVKERQAAFDAVVQAASRLPNPEVDIDTVSNEALDALVREVRADSTEHKP
jgi:hypothetical protein